MDPTSPWAFKDTPSRGIPGDPLAAWFAALEARHLERLTFQEVRRALQALSSLYVERRGRLASGAALESEGKRAAFALFYGPLHFLVVRGIVRALGASSPPPGRIVDLGCGSGAAGAAWALEAEGRPEILGVDRSAWAVQEAAWTYRALGLAGAARRCDLARLPLPGRGGAIVAAFTVNELRPPSQERLLARLLEAGRRGAHVLLVEPLSRRSVPWWDAWSEVFLAAGGRADSWRLPAALPERWRLLDRAAGLDHRELTGRSLWLVSAEAGSGSSSRAPAR